MNSKRGAWCSRPEVVDPLGTDHSQNKSKNHLVLHFTQTEAAMAASEGKTGPTVIGPPRVGDLVEQAAGDGKGGGVVGDMGDMVGSGSVAGSYR